MKKKQGSSSEAINVKKLRKSYGKTEVLKGVDFAVKRGSVLALLGPNGAGKTTTVRILSTLLLPDDGKAFVNGFDVVKQSKEVKASIGLTGQFAAVDEYLTAEENLLMMGRLYRMGHDETRRRANELLSQFDLKSEAKRRVKTYSGGMKRKVDLAMSLISSPPIIFLDEPTTGLDPRSRQTMWEIIKRLVEGGTTILLTTQYMDEADQLADNIIVIDNGKVIAEGTADELKARVGSDRLEFVMESNMDFEKAKSDMRGKDWVFDARRRVISIPTRSGVSDLKRVLDRLDERKIKVESVSLHRPTLDDVFLSLTGHAATTEADTVGAGGKNAEKRES